MYIHDMAMVGYETEWKNSISSHRKHELNKMFTSGKHMGSNLLTQKRQNHAHMHKKEPTQMTRANRGKNGRSK